MEFTITATALIIFWVGTLLGALVWNEWKAREDRKRVMRKRSEYLYPDCVRYQK